MKPLLHSILGYDDDTSEAETLLGVLSVAAPKQGQSGLRNAWRVELKGVGNLTCAERSTVNFVP